MTISLAAYFFVVFFEFVLVITIALYLLSLIYSSIMGSPYVPTKMREIIDIFDQILIKKKSKFLDLGCGDGRIVRLVAQNYGLFAVGVDINPMIIFWARIKAKLARLENASYKIENIFKTDLSDYDIVYLFLMPELLTKLGPKLENETKKGAILISHGFKIAGWDRQIFKILKHEPFSTYYYRLS